LKQISRENLVAVLPDRRILIPALGVTQILSWGSTFYLLGVLAPLIVKDTGWSYDLVVAGVSLGLLVGGIASPRVGRVIGRDGGRGVLAAGALLLAIGLVIIGTAPAFYWYVAGWAVLGLGMSASLYDAAFSTLGGIYGSQARTAITAVTLFGGFASTVCWPLSAVLASQVGWRGTCLSYAAIQIAISLPIHLLVLPRLGDGRPGSIVAAGSPARLQATERLLFAIVAAVLTISAAILSVMGTHLLPILMARGLDASAAVALGMIVGPSQVGARMIEMLAGSHYHPVWTMVCSAILVAIAGCLLLGYFPLVALAIALYGAGNGIGSIARGTVPLALFGPDRYAVLMGRLAMPLLIAMAVSPFLGGLAFQRGGAEWTLGLVAALALVNVVLVMVLAKRAARPSGPSPVAG
jgi:predicted MFS family arabinose efflux permease